METLQLSIRVIADRALKISNRVSTRALRLSNFETFRALKVSNRVSIRALQLSNFETFRALKLSNWVL